MLSFPFQTVTSTDFPTFSNVVGLSTILVSADPRPCSLDIGVTCVL